MDKKMDNVNFVSASSIFDNLDLHVKPMDSPLRMQWTLDEIWECIEKMAGRSRKGRRVYNEVLLPYKRNRHIFNNPDTRPKPIILRVNGATISIATPLDVLCHLYTINLSFPRKTPKKRTMKRTIKIRMENMRQVKILFQHQDQICQWITMMIPSHKRQPTTVNVSWKLDQERIINLAFGASITARDWKDMRDLCIIQQSTDQYLLPRDQGNVVPKLEDWPSGNCSEMNAWTYLCDIITRKKDDGTIQKLQSYSELVDTLKNDREFREFHGPTDEWLIDQKYFDETYGITYICPLLVDHSEMVVLFLDDRGIMFKWSEMEKGMHVLGINQVEGLANYLYNPDKICAVMEDTGELVPEMELHAV